ncbi:hypothetical protein DFJ73DRAFT_784452 [Zopfochytrium polystomum]|nr:hypothetical protein DFJ73DRAFT_784452 [Zopfochytrium polystomum]
MTVSFLAAGDGASDSQGTDAAGAAPPLIISTTLPQTNFFVCYLEPINAGLPWSILVGCALIVYCALASSPSPTRGRRLWRVLLVHAAAGMAGTLAENAWIAGANCSLGRWGWVLLANEVNWVLHEGSTVYYSYIKTKVVLKSPRQEKYLNAFIFALFVAFTGFRLNIGWLRFRDNDLMNNDIRLAHTWAFLVWAVADLVLMVLLVMNAIEFLGRKREGEQEGNFVVVTLLNSSIPRFAVIFVNTILICILNILDTHFPSTRLSNIGKFAWMVRGTYSILLLLDILMTRFLLFAPHPNSSSHHSGRDVGAVSSSALDAAAHQATSTLDRSGTLTHPPMPPLPANLLGKKHISSSVSSIKPGAGAKHYPPPPPPPWTDTTAPSKHTSVASSSSSLHSAATLQRNASFPDVPSAAAPAGENELLRTAAEGMGSRGREADFLEGPRSPPGRW